tara:strand:+ start:183 stop:749 length:567 start_codon:yes stop_codon:yes gene_type:complete
VSNPKPFADHIIRLRSEDNVGVTKTTLDQGQVLADESANLVVITDIPVSHKIALNDIAASQPVKKYGQTLGFATRDIAVGEHVHTHNMGMQDFTRDYAWCVDAKPLTKADSTVEFSGYARANGEVGTRNYIAVISSVNCSASVSRYVADHFRATASKRNSLTSMALSPSRIKADADYSPTSLPGSSNV